MKPLAVFYHCKLSGEGVPSEDFALRVMCSQMDALKRSGLADAASEIHIGVNGGDGDGLTASSMAPNKAQLHIHGKEARTEIPTLNLISSWLKGHEDWYVLYHHTKGITHVGESPYEVWRWCMERGVVWGWKNCVEKMDSGYDSCGCHWLTPERFGAAITSPFWGGTFWWAKPGYLMTLPPLPPPTWENRYEAESWIGRGKRRPKVFDYHPEWPGVGCGK